MRMPHCSSVRSWMVLISICSFFMADALADLLKPVFGRVRPCQVVQGLRLLVRCPHSFSMPSGHAISSFAAATTLFYLPRYFVPILARWYPLLLATAVALSRVYLGVHYPSDVIVGAALGSMVAILVSLVYERLQPSNRGNHLPWINIHRETACASLPTHRFFNEKH